MLKRFMFLRPLKLNYIPKQNHVPLIFDQMVVADGSDGRLRAMDAKLMVNGIEITVPVAALGEAMKQLAPFSGAKGAPATPQSPMPSKAEDQPAASSRAAAWPFPTGNGNGAQATLIPPPAPRPPTESTQEALSPAVALLSLLRSRPDGATPEEVQRALGVEHPKGIGSKMAPINRSLNALGLAPAEVYSNSKRDLITGSRVWTAGPALAEAIKRLKS
jgi:hypothetical protein